jgi:drug/metabolite transporter (DMT)-like permease
MSPALKGALYGLLGFGLFSLADATIKFLGGTYSPVQIVAFAGLFTLPLIGLLWLKAPVPLRPVHPWLMAIRTAALIGNGLLVTYTFTVMPLAQAYAIFFTLPLVLTVLAVPVLGDRIDLVAGLAVVLGLVGVVVALNPGRVEFDIGHVAAVGGVILAAVHYLIVRKTGGAEANVPMLLYPVLGQTISAFLLLPGRYVPMPPADLATVAGLALSGFCGTLMMFAAYRAAAPVIVAPTQYSQIAWAALFGALFFGEPMTWQAAIGMAIIAVAGLMVVARQDRGKPPTA